MARTAITVTRPARNAVSVLGTLAAPASNGIALDQANGMVFTPKRGSKINILIYNSKAGTIVTTVRKGTYPPAEDAGVGDLVVTALATVAFQLIAGLDGSRFFQKDNTVQLDWDAGATGTVWVWESPA